MKRRTFLFCSVVISIVAIATILRLTGTPDKPQTANTSVPQPSATKSPVNIQVEKPLTTPVATTDDTPDEDLTAANEADLAEVKRINAYCKMVDAISSQRKSPDMIFADVAGMNAKKEKWRSFASEKVLEGFRKKTETYTIAYNYKKGGRIVAANFTLLYNPTGDFVKDVYHYFREDGSLGFVMSHFGTFYGEYKFEQRKYFDRNGRLISKSEEYRNMTDERMKIKPEDYETADLRDKIDYYMSVSKLPFAHLLPLKAR